MTGNTISQDNLVRPSAGSGSTGSADVPQVRAMQLAYRGQSVGIILLMLFIRSAFGALFIKHLGGSDRVTMFVLALPGLLPFIQIPLSLLIPPLYGKRFLLGGWTCFGLLMGLIAVIPSVVGHADLALWMVLWVLSLAIIVNLAATTFWFPLLHGIVPADYRGRFFGKLRATWGILLFFAIVGSGLFLGESPDTWRFQVIIFIGVLLVFVRQLFIVPVPWQGNAKAIQADYRDWKQYLKDIFENPGLRRFYLYFALIGYCAGFLGHPLVLYMRDLGFAPRDNIIVFGFTTLGTVLAVYLGGHALDRLGPDRVLAFAHAVIVAMLIFIVGITCLPAQYVRPLFALAFAISGAMVALANLACTTHLFHFAPERGQAFFLAIINVLMFLGPSMATLTTGIVLSQMGPTRTIHFLGTDINLYQIMLTAAGLVALLTAMLLKGISNIHPKQG